MTTRYCACFVLVG